MTYPHRQRAPGILLCECGALAGDTQTLNIDAAGRAAKDARERAALDAHRGLSWFEHGPCPVGDDGGTSCPWCERGCHPAKLTSGGLCEDCARLEAATHTPTTVRRMVARLHVRARRGQLDLDDYRAALRAHRGARG